MPQLADGVEFELGMTVYLPIGNTLEIRTITTDPAKHTIEIVEVPGYKVPCLGLIGSKCSTDIRRFYSSPGTIYTAYAARLRAEVAAKLEEIAEVERLIA